MSLLKLPSELLANIANFARPDGYENFMLACKTCYDAGRIYKEHHIALKSRYSHFRYDAAGIFSPLQLLHAIGQDIWIAEYIFEADLRRCQNLGNEEYPYEDYIDQEPPSKRRRFGNSDSVWKLIQQSDCLQKSGQSAVEWYSLVLEDCTWKDLRSRPDYGNIFLLTLLTNVNRLQLPSEWRLNLTDPKIRAVFDHIVGLAHQGKTNGAPLSRLEILGPSVDDGYGFQTQLHNILPFLNLTSLRRLCFSSGSAMDDLVSPLLSDDIYSLAETKLESVELIACCMGAPECSLFFQKMSHLRALKFSYETKWHGLGHDWEAGDFVASLSSAIGHTLQLLSLTVLNCFGSISPVVTLRGFTKLKDLELDVRLFLGPPYEDMPPRTQRHTENYPKYVPRLLDILPTGIQTFRLLSMRAQEYNRCINDLFRDWHAEKDDVLHQLWKTTIVRGSMRASSASKGSRTSHIPKNVKLSAIEVVDVDEHVPTAAAQAFAAHWESTRPDE